jgi:CheY-like chemotaxis protein
MYSNRSIEPSTSRSGALCILLVDDNEDFATSLAILLEAGGHAVTVASDSPQAIDSASDFQHDVCLLGLSLPSMGGYELVRRLRQLGTTQKAYMIAISGWSHLKDKLQSPKVGFNEHLVKPVDFSQIQLILENVAPS